MGHSRLFLISSLLWAWILIFSPAQASYRISVQGSSLIPEATLIDRLQGAQSLDEIRSRALRAYQNAGYPLVDVKVSNQENQISVRIRENTIKSIVIHDFPENIANLVRTHFEGLLNRPDVRQEELEISTTKSSDYSGIRTQIELDQDVDGRYVLHVHGRYIKSFGSISIENMPQYSQYGSLYLSQQYNSAVRAGDLLRGGVFLGHDFSQSSSAVQGTVYYRSPLSSAGLYFEGIAGSMHTGRLFDGTVPANHFVGRGNQVIALLGYPILRDAHNFLYALQEFEHKDGYSKNPDFQSESRVSASRTYLVFSHMNDDGESLRAGLSLSLGTASHSSTPTYPDIYDKNFWHVRYGLGFTRHTNFVANNTAYKFEIIGQHTNSKVDPLEMFFLSDKNRLRGYAIGEGIGNRGIANTHEFSFYHAVNGDTLQSVSPYLFFDVGHAHLTFQEVAYAKTLASSGIGARFLFKNRLAIDGWLGVPLRDGWSTKKNDPAVFVRFSKAW